MDKMSRQQQKALHVLFTALAEQLNLAGLDMRKILKPHVDIPWSKDTVKEFLWRPIQEAQVLKHSTTELTTQDLDRIFDTLTRHLGEKFGIYQEFPSVETLMEMQNEKEAKSPNTSTD